MSGQKYYAHPTNTFTWPNGAIGHRTCDEGAFAFDCLGPYAKVRNCPIAGTQLRRTCYATGSPDTVCSIPAVCTINGMRILGYFSEDDGSKDNAIEFRVMNAFRCYIQEHLNAGEARRVVEQGL